MPILSTLLVLPSAIALGTSFLGHWFFVLPVIEAGNPDTGADWSPMTTVPYVATAGSSWIDNTDLSFRMWAFFVFNLTQTTAGVNSNTGFNAGAAYAQSKWGSPWPSATGNTGTQGAYGLLGPYAGWLFLGALFAGLGIRAFSLDYDVPLSSFA